MAKFTTGNEAKVAKEVIPKKVTDDPDIEKIKMKLSPGEYYRKSDGLFCYRVPKKDYDGPEKVKPLYDSTLEGLRKNERELLNRLNSQLSVSSKKKTLNDEYELWKRLKTGVKGSTFSNYVYMYEHYVLKSKLGTSFLRLITKSDVKAFYLNLLETTTLKVNTLSNIQGVVYQVLEMAKDDRIIVSNPADGALTEIRRSYEDESEGRIALTVAEQDAFLHALEIFDSWKSIFTVLLLTGMRSGELCGLQWSDVDFDADVIHVRNNLVYYAHVSEDGRSGYDMHDPKSKAGRRDIPMLPLVKEIFAQEQQRQKELGITCAKIVDAFDDFCWLNRFNMPYHHSTLNSAIKRIVLKYNDLVMNNDKRTNGVLLPLFTVHVLRHTCCTRLIENRCNPLAVRGILGHKSLSVTLDIYTSVSEMFKKKEMGLKSTKSNKSYPDIFSEQLNRSKHDKKLSEVKKLFPSCKEEEIEFITQLYSDFTQKEENVVIGYDNL